MNAATLRVRFNGAVGSHACDVIAEIVVTNPARPERGQVRVTDDGAIMWERGYYDAASGDAGEISEVIISSLTLWRGLQ